MKSLTNNSQPPKHVNQSLIEFMLNDPETQMRIGIKESEEKVKNDSRHRKLNAPSSTEEKILLSQ
jgi:hypothetical protein